LAAMPDHLKNKPLLVRIREDIQKVQTLLGSDEGPIPKETAGQVANIAEGLLKDLGARGGKD
jgi:hypothetical protein